MMLLIECHAGQSDRGLLCAAVVGKDGKHLWIEGADGVWFMLGI